MRFVLVDRFLSVEPGRSATALKTFPPDDPVFDDHFPGLPVVPGVLLTEAMGQAAGWALAEPVTDILRKWTEDVCCEMDEPTSNAVLEALQGMTRRAQTLLELTRA